MVWIITEQGIRWIDLPIVLDEELHPATSSSTHQSPYSCATESHLEAIIQKHRQMLIRHIHSSVALKRLHYAEVNHSREGPLTALASVLAEEAYAGKRRKSGQTMFSHLETARQNLDYLLYEPLPYQRNTDAATIGVINNFVFKELPNYAMKLAKIAAIYFLGEGTGALQKLSEWTEAGLNMAGSVCMERITPLLAEYHFTQPALSTSLEYLSYIPFILAQAVRYAPFLLLTVESLKTAASTFSIGIYATLSEAYKAGFEPMKRDIDAVVIKGRPIKIGGKHIDDYFPTLIQEALSTDIRRIIPEGISRTLMGNRNSVPKPLSDFIPFRYSGISWRDIGRFLSYLHDSFEDEDVTSVSRAQLDERLTRIFSTPFEKSGLSMKDMYAENDLERLRKILWYGVERTTRRSVAQRAEYLLMRINSLANGILRYHPEYRTATGVISGVLASYDDKRIQAFNREFSRQAPVYNAEIELLNNFGDLFRLVRESRINNRDESEKVFAENIFDISNIVGLSYDAAADRVRHRFFNFAGVRFEMEEYSSFSRLLALLNNSQADLMKEIRALLPNSGQVDESYSMYLKHATIYRTFSPVDFLTDKESRMLDRWIHANKFGDMLHNVETLDHLGSEKSVANLHKYCFRPITLGLSNNPKRTEFVWFANRPLPNNIIDYQRALELASYAIVQSDAGARWIVAVSDRYDDLPLALKQGLEEHGVSLIPPSLRAVPLDKTGKIERLVKGLFHPTGILMYLFPSLYISQYENIYAEALQTAR
ncbi:MAG: hypothetical protein V1859_02765 [archaeon]